MDKRNDLYNTIGLNNLDDVNTNDLIKMDSLYYCACLRHNHAIKISNHKLINMIEICSYLYDSSGLYDDLKRLARKTRERLDLDVSDDQKISRLINFVVSVYNYCTILDVYKETCSNLNLDYDDFKSIYKEITLNRLQSLKSHTTNQSIIYNIDLICKTCCSYKTCLYMLINLIL